MRLSEFKGKYFRIVYTNEGIRLDQAREDDIIIDNSMCVKRFTTGIVVILFRLIDESTGLRLYRSNGGFTLNIIHKDNSYIFEFKALDYLIDLYPLGKDNYSYEILLKLLDAMHKALFDIDINEIIPKIMNVHDRIDALIGNVLVGSFVSKPTKRANF